MGQAKLDGKLFIVSHYQEPLGNWNELKNTSPNSDSTKTEPQPEAKPEGEPKGILSSSSSTSLSRTSTNAPTPIRYNTPPAPTFKRVEWPDPPTIKTPVSRSQTPSGHNEDSSTECITATASATASATNSNHSSKSPITPASTNLKAPAPRHTVTRHWQEHILLEDPFPRRRWPPGPGRHGNDRAHMWSMPEGSDDYYEKAEQWHISAKELEMSLEKYELEERRSPRRKQRTQSVCLPVPVNDDYDEEEEYEWAQEEDRNYTYSYNYSDNCKDRITAMKTADKSAVPPRRWSDVHCFAAQMERSPTISEAADLGRFGRLGVGK